MPGTSGRAWHFSSALGELHEQPPPALLADVLSERWPEEGTLPETPPDFVVEHGRRAVGIEVKMTDAPGYRHAAGLVRFLAEYPQAVGGILLHGGSQIRRLDERIVAIPWSLLAG